MDNRKNEVLAKTICSIAGTAQTRHTCKEPHLNPHRTALFNQSWLTKTVHSFRLVAIDSFNRSNNSERFQDELPLPKQHTIESLYHINKAHYSRLINSSH